MIGKLDWRKAYKLLAKMIADIITPFIGGGCRDAR